MVFETIDWEFLKWMGLFVISLIILTLSYNYCMPKFQKYLIVKYQKR